ncbi:MAG TPA: Calx-beta domain-containing protein, partial [Pyrinomonadaceae bacterium]|nr:Calx-beta domain-containing protein [Pyrinomonadaceae bacterium]
GSDYTRLAGTLRFLDGETTKTLTLFVTNDALAEGNETVNITLSNPRGALLGSRKTTIVTITDND